MANFPRRTWTTLLFVGLLAPFAVLLILSLVLTPKSTTSRPAEGETPVAAPATAGGPASASGSSPAGSPAGSAPVSPMVLPPRPTRYPLYVAGDEKTLWVAHPLQVDKNGKKISAFELFYRTSGAGAWTLVHDARGASSFYSSPLGMAAASPPATMRARATAYVFLNEKGELKSFSTSENGPVSIGSPDSLPVAQKILATAGSIPGIFALTIGPVEVAATRPGDVVGQPRPLPAAKTTQPAATTAATAHATTSPATAASAASSHAATGPATAASQPAAPQVVNGYWYRDSHWTFLPPMGEAGTAGVPSAAAHVGLAELGDRLVAMWVEPGKPRELVARSLDCHEPRLWSGTEVSELPEDVPANSRLLPVLLDRSIYVLWPVMAAGGSTAELHGGRLDSSYRMERQNFLPPLSLKGAGDIVDPATDVAAGPAENSLAAIVNGKDGGMMMVMFNQHGQAVASASAVEPAPPRKEVLFAQNIAMLLVVLMLTLSFWQWRQRPTALKLPPDMAIAKPGLRAAAFLIDIAIPYVLVCTMFSLWENDGYVSLLKTAERSILNFEVLFADPALLSLLGIYLLHVTVGELFFRRSIGKAAVGLEILMVDGKPPTLAAILVRNLVRLPELLLGILVIYMFISPYRQRLGDLLGRTLVIAHKPPGGTEGEMPPPPPGK